MTFEFDARKSSANKAKHGIDFTEAQRLWRMPVVRTPARDDSEPRELVIGRIEQKFWSAIVTHRGDAIRLISVRRARREEIELYRYETRNDPSQPG